MSILGFCGRVPSRFFSSVQKGSLKLPVHFEPLPESLFPSASISPFSFQFTFATFTGSLCSAAGLACAFSLLCQRMDLFFIILSASSFSPRPIWNPSALFIPFALLLPWTLLTTPLSYSGSFFCMPAISTIDVPEVLMFSLLLS